MYFLTILASESLSTMVPRAWRMNFAWRLIIPWRLPWAAALTLPVPVILKRFLAPLLVFILGIWLDPFSTLGLALIRNWPASSPKRPRGTGRSRLLRLVKAIEAATACPAGRLRADLIR